MIKIAIDGYTGSGKSTLAKEIASRLNFSMLDTGAIFRTIAYGFYKTKQDFNEDNVLKYLKGLKVEVKLLPDGQHTYLYKEDATPFIRTENISQLASKISAIPKVRDFYLKIAKKFANNYNTVMEGRDIGTVVMPDADVKIFLTANEEVRAKRRYLDVVKKDPSTKLSDVLADLKQRDERDSTRKIAPLKPSEDSIIVDNTNLTFDQTVDKVLKIINKKLNS